MTSWHMAGRRWLLGGVLLLATGAGSGTGRAKPPARAVPLTPAQQQQLAQARAQAAQANKLWQQGKRAEAIQAWQQKLDRERAVWGDTSAQLVPSLQTLALRQEGVNDFAAAHKALHEVLVIQQKRRGEKHWQVSDARRALADLDFRARLTPADRNLLRQAESLNEQVVRLWRAGRSRQALPLAQRAVALRGKLLGEDHSDYARSLFNLAAQYKALAEYARAEPLYLRGLQIREASLGKDHPDVATNLYNLAGFYRERGRYPKAEPLYLRSLRLREASLGKDHPDVANSLNGLALLYRDQGRYGQAEPLLKRSLQIQERRLGKDHPAVAASLNNLAMLYKAQGQYTQAEPLYQRALQIKESRLGPTHPAVALSLNNLAALCGAQGQYARAEPLYQRSLQISERRLGKDHPAVAQTLNNLGLLYERQGRYARAEPLLQRGLQIRERRLGQDHPEVASSLDNLGLLYQAQGQFAKAEPLLQRSLQIRVRRLGQDHPEVAAALNNLAILYKCQGRYTQAESFYRRSLEIKESRLAPDHPDLASSLNNLAALYQVQGQYAQAETLLQRSLQIRARRLDKDHPALAHSLHNLARLYQEQGRYGQAETLFTHSLEIRERRLGKDHPYVAVSLNDLALLHQRQGHFARAESLFQRALQIDERRLGQNHPDVIVTLDNLAGLYGALERWAEAGQTFDRARRGLRPHLRHLLPALSPQQQLTYLRAEVEPQFHTALSLALQRRRDPGLAERSAAWLANGKGLTQQALAEPLLLARAGETPARSALFARLLDVRRQLANLTLALPRSGQDQHRRLRLQALGEQEEQLTQELGQQSGQALRVTPWIELDQVRRALPAGAVLIDLARFDVFQFQARGQQPRWQPAHYAAWVIPPHGRGRVRLVDLGPAARIEAAVRRVRQALTAAPVTIRKEGEAAAATALQQPLQALARLVLHPLLPHIGTRPRWIVSPDAALWLVPWAALPLPDGKYALEKHQIVHVSSGRDLVAPAARAVPQAAAVLVADPDFDLAPAQVQAQTRRLLPSPAAAPVLRGLLSAAALPRFPRLPGTAAEARLLTPLLRRWTGHAPQVRTGRDALEGVVKALQRPRVLVLSTHGFFLEDQDQAVAPAALDHGQRGLKLVSSVRPQPRGQPVQVLEHPLLRCGLALAGANHRAQAQAEADDGILTGLEIVGCDLRGCELVVLSACETGLGQVNIGEGVAGLRQAFQLAGAQAVVATLWKVPDQETTALMQAFFSRLAATRDKGEALRQAQLEILKTRRANNQAAHPFYWAAFTLTARWR